MNKTKLPYLSKKAFTRSAQSLLKHMHPTIKKIGAAPGTLTYTGEDTTPTEIKFFKFEDQSLKFESYGNIEEIQENLSKRHIN